MVKVKINSKIKKMDGQFVRDIALKLKINLDDYLIIKNKSLVTEDYSISDDDELEFISIVSSG